MGKTEEGEPNLEDAQRFSDRDFLVALNAGVANVASAASTLGAVLESLREENKIAHEAIKRDVAAKLDNVERAVSDQSNNIQLMLEANNRFLEKLEGLLQEERSERKELVAFLRGDSRAALERAQQKQDTIEADAKNALSVIWTSYGKYVGWIGALIVAYLALTKRITLP